MGEVLRVRTCIYILCVSLSFLIPKSHGQGGLLCGINVVTFAFNDCYNQRNRTACIGPIEYLLSDNCNRFFCVDDNPETQACVESPCTGTATQNETGLCPPSTICCESPASTLPPPTKCEDLPPDNGIAQFEHEFNNITVFCDGDWTVMQRRTSGDQDFDLTYAEYENGFGESESGHWLGLNNTLQLLSRGNHEVRFEFNDTDGNNYYVHYDSFNISSPEDGYRLNIDGYNMGSSNANGDSIENHKGMQFTTKDKDQDTVFFWNCAGFGRGGWWYNHCTRANFNGIWNFPLLNLGPVWVSVTGRNNPLQYTAIKFRLVDEGEETPAPC